MKDLVTVKGGNITCTSIQPCPEEILENNLRQATLNCLEGSTVHFCYLQTETVNKIKETLWISELIGSSKTISSHNTLNTSLEE